MDLENCSIASGLVSKSYIEQGSQALVRRRRLIKSLISQRRLPDTGWDDETIELFLREVSLMDSNNFVDNVGLGEREGRVLCPIVRQRNFGLSHGIGRSGELSAVQPKAAGSSLLAKLTAYVVRDALETAGLSDIGRVLVVPVATGMALTLCLMGLRSLRPDAKYVIWPRIDQKTCLKCITAAGYIPVVVPLVVRDSTYVESDVDDIRREIDRIGPENVVCVLSTMSCFAPRAPDDVVGIAKLCQEREVPHIVNNAYGVQSRHMCKMISSAWRKGRVDGVVQSTDKNFMVPVGGAVVACSRNKQELVETVDSLYPGRASISATLDMLITLLHLGRTGWLNVLQERDESKIYLQNKLGEFAEEIGEIPIIVPGNDISFGLTLNSLSANASLLGAMLFQRCASGARVIVPGTVKKVSGIGFNNYGSSSDEYPHAYMTIAAALGANLREIDTFFDRLRKALITYKKQQK